MSVSCSETIQENGDTASNEQVCLLGISFGPFAALHSKVLGSQQAMSGSSSNKLTFASPIIAKPIAWPVQFSVAFVDASLHSIPCVNCGPQHFKQCDLSLALKQRTPTKNCADLT